ncbi:MAG: SDR family NAD(P)-dependent oxidoreductase [Candidatus Binatia bacterium]
MGVLERYRLDGKVAIVTGAGRGLGREMALALAAAGADIVAAARTQEQLEETARLVQAKGQRCLIIQTDVTDSTSVNHMVEVACGEFGHIDIMVNNAGGATRGWNKPLEVLTDEQWRNGVDLNITSTFYCCRAILPHMIQQGGGKIINITSGLGVRASRYNFMYSTAKAGMINFTRALAMNYADKNIQATLILPGIFPHDNPELVAFWQGGKFIPVGRPGKDNELGPLCVFLASDAANYMNGELVAIEGGGLAGGEVPTGFAPIIPLTEGGEL